MICMEVNFSGNTKLYINCSNLCLITFQIIDFFPLLISILVTGQGTEQIYSTRARVCVNYVPFNIIVHIFVIFFLISKIKINYIRIDTDNKNDIRNDKNKLLDNTLYLNSSL